MSPNKIKQFRTQKSITQRGLAELVGTSQQQIQRIESGNIAANLATAQAICAALGKPLGVVFPSADKAVSAFSKKRLQEGAYSDEDLSSVADKGIEMDGSAWILKLFLRGHQDYLVFPINQSDKRRMYAHLNEREQNDVVQFFVFDSDEYRFALNVHEVVFHQLLFESLAMPVEIEEVDEDDYSNVRITFTNGGPTIGLSVESDEPEDGEDDDIGQLGGLFSLLECDPAPGERLQITDVDGEDAFIRAGSIAMLQVALSALEPTEYEEEDEDE